MKLFILKYLRGLVPVLLLTLLNSGCGSKDSIDTPEDVSGRVSISFNILPLSHTRSNPDNHDEEEGSGGELTIYDGKWLHVYIHDALTNELILHFNHSQANGHDNMVVIKNDDGSYFVKLATHLLTPGKQYRVSVMANCLDETGDLYNLTPQFTNTSDNPDFLQHPHWMPFSGFRTFTFPAQPEKGKTYNLGNLWLLRAAARIDVLLSEEMKKKWTITEAVIEGAGYKLNSHSYASPGLTNIRTLSGTEDLTMQQMFNPYRVNKMNNPTGADISMGDVKNDHTYFRIYLPEQENPLPDSGEEIKIRLKMNQTISNTDVIATLYLRNYGGNEEPINLVRNHIYRFEVITIKPLFDVDLDIIAPQDRIIVVPSFN